MNDSKSLLEKFRIRKGFNLISLPSITLNEQEADRFIDYVVDESSMKNFARIERMNKPQKNIRALGFGSGTSSIRPRSSTSRSTKSSGPTTRSNCRPKRPGERSSFSTMTSRTSPAP
ncbi:MAG: hypothetical protein M0R66_05480 [Candidatus Omnitrophica bacterium]|nr:hypothetical protein [Candidatus Omnitrophota bacterium]